MTRIYVAAYALLTDGARWLVVRRAAANGYMPGRWDLPGGIVEAGETVEAALVREVAEETSLAITPVGPIFVHTHLAQLPTRQTFQLVYRCERCERRGEIRLNPREHDEYAWVRTLDEVAGDSMSFLSALAAERGLAKRASVTAPRPGTHPREPGA